MADHPTVTTPGGTDVFASLASMDYSTYSDDSMAMLVEENLPTELGAPRTGLTPGGAGANSDAYLMTPRTAELMAELGVPTGTTPVAAIHRGQQPPASAQDGLAMLFDHDLVTSGLTEADSDAGQQEDLPTPLNFTFTPTGTGRSGGGVGGMRYHVAPMHKHKRVRSNPDMLQGLSFQQLMGNPPASGSSPLRPSVDAVGSHHSVSLPTTPMDASIDSNGNSSFQPMPEPLPINIGPVNVMTPVGFHAGSTPANGEDADMVSFLKEMQWSELGENANSMDAESSDTFSSANFHSQRIQAGMNELKMKRKRPTHHARHHSNPVDLLHNLDQFRMMSQQQQQPQQQQQQQQLPFHDPMQMQFPSPTKMEGIHSQMMAPNPFELQQPIAQDMQFQVPTEIANGTARSLHNRRSSMPNSAFHRGHARRGATNSTGLSMDMSQMNLSFLTLPEEEFQQQLQDQRQQQAYQQAMGPMGGFQARSNSPLLPQQNSPPQRSGKKGTTLTAAELEAESMRKSYKCGRCGQPKVGHVCTMPELRNNWTQADLEVTKGTKLVRLNCQIVGVKSKWIAQHEDNM